MRIELENILKDYVRSKEALEDIINYVLKELNVYQTTYDYFGIKKEAWERLMLRGVKNTITLIPFK